MRAGQIDLLNLAMPITLRPSAPVSDEELMRFSEQNKPFRIERNQAGDLVVKQGIGALESRLEAFVSVSLWKWNESAETGTVVGPNVGFNLSDGSCLAPDAAWLALNRWTGLTEEQQNGFLRHSPDFLIEFRDRSESRSVLEAKMQTWLDNGAKLAWLIDPIDGKVTIYRPNQPPETLDRPEIVKAEPPVAGFELPCARLWSPR
jgi:Uma2 family endonuclease